MQSKRPLKILMLSMEYSPEISGGVGTQVQELSTGLSRNGDRVLVISCTLGKPGTIREANRTVHLLPPSVGGNGATGSSSITKGILDFNNDLVSFAHKTGLADFGIPDVIQCSNWLTFPAAYQLGRDLAIPVVCTIHFLSEPSERWWGQIPDPEIVEQEAIAFRKADRIITVSHSMQALVRMTHHIPDNKIDVVYNGIDAEAFSQNVISLQQSKELKAAIAPSGQKIVFFAGRLNPQKGVSAILASIPAVLADCPNVKYVFAGEPDSRSFAGECQEILQRNPALRNHVMFLGKLPRHNIAALYKISDVALVPSIYEPFGYAAVEAMAAGVPLVATAAGGLAEIIDHEKTGLLVALNRGENGTRTVDISGLAAATKTMLQNQALARTMARHAGNKVRAVFTIEALVNATRAVYQMALSDFQPHHAGSAAVAIH